jgi:hypothetical protein
MDYTNAGSFHAEQFRDLSGGKFRDRDQQIGAFGGPTRLRRKTLAEFAARVFAGEDKQIMKRCDCARKLRVDPLIQAVKEFAGPGSNSGRREPGSPRICRQFFAEGLEQPVGSIRIKEGLLRMGMGKPAKNLARVNSYSREMLP